MSLLFKEWLPAQEAHALRVKDVKHMKKGEKMDLAIFDRDIKSIVDEAVKEKKIKINRAYSIGNLLKRLKQIATYEHDQGITGTLVFRGENEAPFSFDILDSKKKVWKSAEKQADVRNDRIIGYHGYAIPVSRINRKEKVKIQVNRVEPLETYL